MRTIVLITAVAVALVWLAIRSQVSAAPSAVAPDEPITGTSSSPRPGGEQIAKDPFAPYDLGDPAAAWSYTTLSTDEKAVVDRGRGAAGWTATHDAFKTAALGRAAEASAAAATHQLGLENLGNGVIP